jgi:hypothetical protein
MFKLITFFTWRLICSLAFILFLGVLQMPSELHAQAPGISSPAPGSAVSGAVPIIGTAVIDSFQRYELYYKQDPSGDESYIYFDGDTRQVTGGQLGVWQTSDLAPGAYTIRMRVVKADGNYSEHFVPNLSVNQQPPTPTPTETPETTEETQTSAEDPGGPTPTPIPISTPTPVPQPTPVIVQVEQPNLVELPAAAEPTPTQAALVALGGGNQTGTGGGGSPSGGQPAANPAAVAVTGAMGESFTAELGTALSLDRLREHFFTGVRYSAGIFILILGIFVGKRLLEWTLSRAG